MALRTNKLFDTLFQGLTFSFAPTTILLLGSLLYEIYGKALPAFNKIKFSSPYSTTWDVN